MKSNKQDNSEKKVDQSSRRQFLKTTGKIMALSALTHFSAIGYAKPADHLRDVCDGDLTYVPGLDKCGVSGTPDEPGCLTAYWACYILGHRPE